MLISDHNKGNRTHGLVCLVFKPLLVISDTHALWINFRDLLDCFNGEHFDEIKEMKVGNYHVYMDNNTFHDILGDKPLFPLICFMYTKHTREGICWLLALTRKFMKFVLGGKSCLCKIWE